VKEQLYDISSKQQVRPNLKSVVNNNIGTLDLETYKHSRIKDMSYVFALGFKIHKGKEEKFYLNKDESSDDLVLRCINSMLINEYNGFIFYVHNLAGYDIPFILKALDSYNMKKNEEYYVYKPFFREDKKIIKLEIKVRKELSDRKQAKIGVRKEPSKNKITLIDSYSLLPSSLESLGKDFESNVLKDDYFPYDFVNESTLYYVGNTPDICYYNGIDKKEYNLIKKSNWDLKEETLNYLSNDLNCLMSVIDIFNKYILEKFDIQMTECLTLPRLSLNIFKKDYMGKSKIPLINKKNMYNFIRKGYYGGISEVYKPYIDNGFYYDVNSLYPFAAKNPMPGTECYFIEDFSGLGLNLDELFGFFYCKVKTNEGYLGLLPIHKNGDLILPNGEFDGVWFSEELKYARDNGYDIKVIKGYNFNKIYNVFDKFVDELYEIKSKSKGAVKAMYKFLLNALIGRLALGLNKPKTEIVDKERLDLISSIHDATYDYLGKEDKDRFLVIYDPEISRNKCEENDLDYFKVLNKYKVNLENTNKYNDLSISTAAAVTAYARIYMNQIKILILSLGGKIYYMDTDSIVTNIQLPADKVGNNLGKFKLEYEIMEGYFISSKLYCLKCIALKEGKRKKKMHIVSKSVIKEDLSLFAFKNMYFENKDVIVNKNQSQIKYAEGTTYIGINKVKLRYDAYTKREKIYINNI
jgi:hypothetical protein